MKKISALVLILILCNFICSSYIVFAVEDEPEQPEAETSGSSTAMSMDEFKKIADEGKVTIGSSEKQISIGKSDVGSAGSMLGTFITTMSAIAARLMQKFTADGGYYYYESDFSAEKTGLFTVNSLVFGEYVLFNAKPYQKSSDLATDPGHVPEGINQGIDSIKERGEFLNEIAAKIVMWLMAPMLLVAIIRAISSDKATDLAAWRKILIRCALCMFLVYGVKYIFAIIYGGADILIDSFWRIRVALENEGYNAFETTVIENLSLQLQNTGGVTSLAYSVLFAGLVIMQVLFLIKYFFRALALLLLFIISPIITFIHFLKLLLGKDSDSLESLLKYFALLVFMQPLHALFYLVFFFSLSEIAISVPAMGIVLLYALYRANNIAKAMLGWELGSSILSSKS